MGLQTTWCHIFMYLVVIFQYVFSSFSVSQESRLYPNVFSTSETRFCSNLTRSSRWPLQTHFCLMLSAHQAAWVSCRFPNGLGHWGTPAGSLIQQLSRLFITSWWFKDPQPQGEGWCCCGGIPWTPQLPWSIFYSSPGPVPGLTLPPESPAS